MPLNHSDLSKKYGNLFHLSEEPGIKLFIPRPSPSFFSSIKIKGEVVFAIEEQLLHNYILPRECPRITYFVSHETSVADKKIFIGESRASYIVNVESA